MGRKLQTVLQWGWGCREGMGAGRWSSLSPNRLLTKIYTCLRVLVGHTLYLARLGLCRKPVGSAGLRVLDMDLVFAAVATDL